MKRLILLICLILASVALGWFLGSRGFFSATGGRFGPSGPESISSAGIGASETPMAARGPVALGRLEPAGKVIDLNGMPGDRLASVVVQENAEVHKNDPLAYLDSRSLRHLELQAVQSQVQEAQQRRSAEEKAADARIATAQVALNQAQSYGLDLKVQEGKIGVLQKDLDNARLEQRRLKELKSTDIVSAQDREQQDLAVAKAQAELQAAQAVYEKGKTSGKLGVAAAEADLKAAQAGKNEALSTISIEPLKRKEEIARQQWERTVIRAPCDGTVLRVLLRPGETLGPSPILQMADRSRMVVQAEVYEADVKRLGVGHQAKVTSRAFPSPYDESGLSGTVSRIGNIVAPPDLKPLNPLAPADRHVIEVRVDLDPQGSKVAANFIHLQVEVQFAPQKRGRSP